MNIIRSNFFLEVTLIIIYLKSFTDAAYTHRCGHCKFEPHDKKYLTEDDTLDPRGCFVMPSRIGSQKYTYQTYTCSWDIALEPFEVFENTNPKVWRLVPPGYVTTLLFGDHKNSTNMCEHQNIPYAHTPNGTIIKIIRCYCGPSLCNKNWPLCKWIRAVDPKYTNPVGCVEDDEFPSKKEPNLYQGLVYKRTDDEPVPTGSNTVGKTVAPAQPPPIVTTEKAPEPPPIVTTEKAPQPTPIIETEKPTESKSSGSRTCGDQIDEIYNGIKEIQQLLKDEL